MVNVDPVAVRDDRDVDGVGDQIAEVHTVADLDILEVSLAPIDAVQTPLDTEPTSATDAEHSLLIEEVKVGCSIQFACRPTSFEEARSLVRQVRQLHGPHSNGQRSLATHR